MGTHHTRPALPLVLRSHATIVRGRSRRDTLPKPAGRPWAADRPVVLPQGNRANGRAVELDGLGVDGGGVGIDGRAAELEGYRCSTGGG